MFPSPRALILGLLSGIGPLCTDFYLPALPEITQQLQATSTQTQLSLTAALIGLGLGSAVFRPAERPHWPPETAGAVSAAVYLLFGDVRPDPRYQHADCLALFYKALPAPAARCCRDPSPAINTEGTLLTQFFALLMTVNGIAPVLSPVLGGYVITAFDWRILFWTMAAIGGVLLVMSPAILRKRARPQRRMPAANGPASRC